LLFPLLAAAVLINIWLAQTEAAVAAAVVPWLQQ
jgi:hypothetical protein